MKKDVVRKIVAPIMILAAIVLLCWPAVAHIQSAYKVASAPGPSPDKETEEYADLMEAARQYNAMLADAPYHKPTDAEMEQYMSLMNVTGTGIMGSISIPKINVQLPIYHDVTESVLQVAVGHMPGTSLPVVSESSHVVISGHNGLITSAMFAELPRLQEGDTFQITALRQVLTYEVDQILTVRPDEVEAVAIMPGKEYCTLITCTPPGLNTYRLLVRGHRIDAEILDAAVTAPTFAGFMQEVFRGKVLSLYEVVMLCIALILLVAEFAVPLGLAIYRRNHKKYKQRTQRWTRDNT